MSGKDILMPPATKVMRLDRFGLPAHAIRNPQLIDHIGRVGVTFYPMQIE